MHLGTEHSSGTEGEGEAFAGISEQVGAQPGPACVHCLFSESGLGTTPGPINRAGSEQCSQSWHPRATRWPLLGFPLGWGGRATPGCLSGQGHSAQEEVAGIQSGSCLTTERCSAGRVPTFVPWRGSLAVLTPSCTCLPPLPRPSRAGMGACPGPSRTLSGKDWLSTKDFVEEEGTNLGL